MLTPRQYQQEAVDAVFAHWQAGGRNPLVELATGTGKALVIALIILRALAMRGSVRILMLVHTRELVAQNERELLGIAPHLRPLLGVLCGGLDRYEADAQIVFATVQTAASRLDELGERTLVLVDECHRVPFDAHGQYGAVVTGLVARNRITKVCGTTATVYRLDRGRLDEGEGRLFDSVVYTYGIGEGVRDGHLSPLVSKATALRLSTNGVARRGGEFVASELQRAVDTADLVEQAVAETMSWAERMGRAHAIAFCAGVEHARNVAAAFVRHGWRCKAVTGDMPMGERDDAIADFKAGRLDCLTNVDVLTTGFNAPFVDLIALLRPTLSTGLYVQMLGRGTRLAPGKTDCLVLDFAGNVRRHGPVDNIQVASKEERAKDKDELEEKEQQEGKECPSCAAIVARSVRVCPYCEHVFPARELKHDGEADGHSSVMMGEAEAAWQPVRAVVYARNEGKNGKPDTLRVSYRLQNGGDCTEWICLGHTNHTARTKAERWWLGMSGEERVPQQVTGDLARACYRRLPEVTHIRYRPRGQFFDVVERLCVKDGNVWAVDEKGRRKRVSRDERDMAREAATPAMEDDGFPSEPAPAERPVGEPTDEECLRNPDAMRLRAAYAAQRRVVPLNGAPPLDPADAEIAY